MQQQEFLIQIHAPREKVWSVLWDDTTFRDWASNIDEGTYMAGEMKEGNEVQFISSVSKYGVTSLIVKLIPNQFVSFKQLLDTKDSGKHAREKEWADGTEFYSLVESDGITTLKIVMDIPPSQEETFNDRVPKALERIKFLAEET